MLFRRVYVCAASGLTWRATPGNVTMTDAYKARVAEGVQIVKDRIHQALGE